MDPHLGTGSSVPTLQALSLPNPSVLPARPFLLYSLPLAGSSLVSVPPLVATDPAGRCAAALLHGRLLAVLPAIQADVLELLVAAQVGWDCQKGCGCVGV
jgi:hypothetical protein